MADGDLDRRHAPRRRRGYRWWRRCHTALAASSRRAAIRWSTTRAWSRHRSSNAAVAGLRADVDTRLRPRTTESNRRASARSCATRSSASSWSFALYPPPVSARRGGEQRPREARAQHQGDAYAIARINIMTRPPVFTVAWSHSVTPWSGVLKPQVDPAARRSTLTQPKTVHDQTRPPRRCGWLTTRPATKGCVPRPLRGPPLGGWATRAASRRRSDPGELA